MTLKPNTGPYLLMAGGGILLAAGLLGLQLPMIVFAAILGLGFWSLRGLQLGRFLTGPVLLMTSAAALVVVSLVSQQPLVFLAALLLAGLGLWTLRGFALDGALVGPLLLAAAGVALAVAGLIAGQVIMFAMAFAAIGLACFAWLRAQG
ncbi:MAG: hypothetical protein LW712_08510 [Burkholderiaceae bacterium]|nr:hypothetical protein [Burkholderiaceae bacterium]